MSQPLPLFLSARRPPQPSAPPAGGGGGTITHGSQLIGGETSLVGYTALFDSTLHRNLTAADLTRQTGSHWISDFTGGSGGTSTTPKVVYGIDVDELLWDVDWVTIRGSRIRQNASGFLNGVHHVGCMLDYVTFDSAVSDGTECMHYESFSMNRCLVQGYSDGLKVNGGTTPQVITETIIKTLAQDAADHNDCAQNVGGAGSVSFQRCLFYQDPIGSPGQGNSAILSADFAATGTPYYLESIDSYIYAGTTATSSPFRLYDGALRSNITYKATGNIFNLSANRSVNPLDRGTANTTPTAQITWSGNTDDLGNTIPLA